MTKDFWEKCIELGTVVVPFMAHSQYNTEGNTDKTTEIGIKFVCMNSNCDVVINATEFFLMIDDCATRELVADTPEEALRLWESYLEGWGQRSKELNEQLRQRRIK